MNMRRQAGILLAVLGTALLTGCPKDQPNQVGGTTGTGAATGSPPPTGAKLKIAVIPKGTQHQFWKAVNAGAVAAGNEDNCDIIWIGPNPENDITDQVNKFNTQVTSKVDGIVLAATDATALVNPVKAAMAKNIPVVTIDSGIKGDDPVAYIATDNAKGGEAAADFLAKQLPNGGKLGLLIFGKGSVSSDEREKGFLAGVKKYPKFQVVSNLEAALEAKAFNNVTNMLTAHPDIVGIFAANEANGVSAAQVLDQKKLVGKVKLVAFDSSDSEVAALKAGSIQALIVQDPYQMGYKGVKTVVMAIKKQPIKEKTVDSGFMVITKENMNTPEAQKLINPKY